MNLDKTFDAINDYAKFIVTLWGSYIGVTTVMIGWLLTLRNGSTPLGGGTLLIVAIAYLLISGIFYLVVSAYQSVLKRMMRLGYVYARQEVDRLQGADNVAADAKSSAPAADLAKALLEMFDCQPGMRALDRSLWFIWVVTLLVLVFMLSLSGYGAAIGLAPL